MALKIRSLPDKLQELSRNINDPSTNTEINKLHQKAEGVCNCVTKAFTVTGSDVLKEKEKLSRVSCPSRVDIERLSQTLVAFKGDLRTCTNEIVSIKSSIHNFVGVNRCTMKLKENEIKAAKTEVDGLDKQIQLTQKEISKYEDEAYNEERGAVDLEDRASDLRRKSEEHKEKGWLWGVGSLLVGIVFAPFTLGASLGAGLVSAGVGIAGNFNDAKDCVCKAASLRVSAQDKKELAKRKGTLKAEYESKKCTKTTELRNCKTKIDDLARTCDRLTSLEGLLTESISGFERVIYIAQVNKMQRNDLIIDDKLRDKTSLYFNNQQHGATHVMVNIICCFTKGW
ncbi:uncharacterized protein LOC132724207 [Ruditapes philippinarum]|uniref:uncharacterized protein LOC132724207 n=1 Tax=Ruditapes philippinarum TaxID=129788 RepID=UPI00295BC431|nr:uncharacterized protein LOC132724207 [Ruditapes philippinarum]